MRRNPYARIPKEEVRPVSVAALKEALSIVGGVTELSRQIGISRQIIHRFLTHTDYGVSARDVLAIEHATDNLVSRYDLRMDIYPRRS